MSLALLFSGQGTQHPQMLPWLDERSALVRATCRALAVDDWRGALTDPAWSGCNRHAQVLLTGLALAAWQQLSSQVPASAVIAGYSVGELAAFGAAGVFDADTALALASARAHAMDRCAAQAPGGLLSVGGVDRAAVAAWCAETGTAIAIDIAEDSQIVGGTDPALRALEARALASGARTNRLHVAVASHTPAMQAAADAFAAVLQGTPLRAPAATLLSNASGEAVRGRAEIVPLLAGQVAQTVRWRELLQTLHERRVTGVLEIGPGNALAAHWNRRFPEVPARSADEFRSLAALVRWLASTRGH